MSDFRLPALICYSWSSEMEGACVRLTQLPNTSRLFADLVYDFERVSQFYQHAPFSDESWVQAARAVDYPGERRKALVAALSRLNAGNPLLEELAQPGTLVVVTGQQVGLFSGPAYTIYKALTAVRLARHLTGQGIRAVPVFWMATEDHDFAEIDHCRVFDTLHRPVTLSIGGEASNRPVGERPLGEVPVERLREALREFAFGDDVTDVVAEAYKPGRPVGEAFGDLLRRLLGPRVLLLDPLEPALRRMASPLLAQAVEAAPELTARLLERNKALEAAGYHAQVHIEEDTSLFFLLENGRRVTLRRHGDQYRTGERRLESRDLAARAGSLSPNALLRPVMEDWLLPTVAYVGGPAELAYLAQSAVIYDTLLGRMPVAVPRAAFTLLDERSSKLMRRYSLNLRDFFHGQDVLRGRMAEALTPAELARSVEETHSAVAEAVDGLRGRLEAFDPTLAAALDKSRAKMLYQVSKIGRKIAREALRRDERAGRDAAQLYGLIYPDKHLQERYYTILPFLARHGLDLPGRLCESLPLNCPDHVVLGV